MNKVKVALVLGAIALFSVAAQAGFMINPNTTYFF